jgi:DNA-directed RNA polymerase I, II, and III subunit RPABC2
MSYFGGGEDYEHNSDSDNETLPVGGRGNNADEGDGDDDVEEDVEEEENDDDEEEEENGENEDDPTGGAGDDDLEEGEIGEDSEDADKNTKRTKKIPAKNIYKQPEGYVDEDDEDDEDGEQYLQKFERSINENYVLDFHPESVTQNYDEILTMVKVTRDKDGIIIDKLHRTIPYLTKYEKSRILGQRAKQINSGATPFVKVPEKVIDGYVIAELELKEKQIPFIIRRPLPNGGSEYWSIKDLENISF